ncbi:hypothetical protein HAX54_039305, partial [Datura stramonium]|nr:hypothetical protein [Datura stramonium]
MTLLLEEPYRASHLKKEKKIDTGHEIYHPKQHEQELGTRAGEHGGGEEELDLIFRVLVGERQRIKGYRGYEVGSGQMFELGWSS